MEALLRGPLAKIERAKSHIGDLNGQISAYLSGGPFELRVRQSDNPPERLVYTETREPIPPTLSLILGDAVHNLRAALDHLCFAMVGSKAPNPKQVGFPFVEGPDSLASAIATRQMNVASKYVVDEIHALKPYPSGNKYLHAVKSVDERDKHHFIVTTGLGIEVSIAQLQQLVGPDRIECDDPHHTFASTIGDFLVQLHLDAPVECFDKKADFQPQFTIGFGEGETLMSAPVIPALSEMAIHTEDAVHRLADAFFR